MYTDNVPLSRLSERIIGCSMKVHNVLGVGFVEKVYENALARELTKAGLDVSQQHSAPVVYDGAIIGTYTPDLLVESTVIVELKAVRALEDVHRAQCLNYLKATGLHLCLLINFGNPRLIFKRVILGPAPERVSSESI